MQWSVEKQQTVLAIMKACVYVVDIIDDHTWLMLVVEDDEDVKKVPHILLVVVS